MIWCTFVKKFLLLSISLQIIELVRQIGLFIWAWALRLIIFGADSLVGVNVEVFSAQTESFNHWFLFHTSAHLFFGAMIISDFCFSEGIKLFGSLLKFFFLAGCFCYEAWIKNLQLWHPELVKSGVLYPEKLIRVRELLMSVWKALLLLKMASCLGL